MPFALWHAAARIAEYVPGAPLTRDQIALMQCDNVASPHLPGLTELGIQPTPIEAVLSNFEATGERRTSTCHITRTARNSASRTGVT